MEADYQKSPWNMNQKRKKCFGILEKSGETKMWSRNRHKSLQLDEERVQGGELPLHVEI
jgi:hypothetical protein